MHVCFVVLVLFNEQTSRLGVFLVKCFCVCTVKAGQGDNSVMMYGIFERLLTDYRMNGLKQIV